jgi:hypothetical protein
MVDAEIVARCIAEARTLITRDRHLEARAHGPVRVIRLTANRVEEQARALPGIDWQYAPFTRCLVDNTPLSPAPPEMADQVPSDSRAAGGPLQGLPRMRPALLARRACPAHGGHAPAACLGIKKPSAPRSGRPDRKAEGVSGGFSD